MLHTGGDLEFFLDVHREWLTLRRVKHLGSSKREDTDLGKVPLDLREAKDGALQLEVSIQGNLITIMADGAKVMEVRDEVAAGIGDIALVAPSETTGSGKIKDLAFRLLDDAPDKVIAGNEPAPEAHGVRLWDAPDKIPKETAVRWENGAVVLGDSKDKGQLTWSQPRSRDAVIRAEIRLNRDAGFPQLRLRYNPTEGPGDFYRLQLEGGMLDLSVSQNGVGRTIKSWPLQRAYGDEEWARLELRSVGDALTVSLDGKELETIHDSTLSSPGSVMIAANKNGAFRHVEYVPLDPSKASESASEQGLKWSNWEPVGLSTFGLIKEADGYTTDKPLKGWGVKLPATRSAAVRVTYESRGSGGVQITAHEKGSGDTRELYVAHVNFESLYIGHKIPGGTVPFLAKKMFPSETFSTGEHVLEFRIDGDTLTASIDGKLKVTAQDAALKDGPWSVVAFKGALVKKLEFQVPTSDIK